ncbi:MAG: low molecular weight protein-tyrosine-phosphatase [Acidobacteriota bacterium]
MGKKRVLFVCLGNICRSPAGEGVFRGLLEQKGLQDDFEVDSAGTSTYHVGETPDPRMRQAAAGRGYRLAGHSRRLAREDFEKFDLILAMDRSNMRHIRSADRKGEYRHKVRLFCDFVPGSGLLDVPDPYYGGHDGFEKVLDLLEAGAHSLLEHMQSLPEDGS